MTIQLNPTVSDAYESKTLAQMRQLVFDGMGFMSTYLTTRTETLLAIRTDLYNMLGYAAMAIVPSGVNAMLNSYINNAQQMLNRSLETAGIFGTQNAVPPAVLVNDTDVSSFDGQAIRQLALGMAKGHKGQEDGQLYVAASGKFLKDLAERMPPNAVTLVNRMLKDAQIELYRQYSVFRMQRWFTWTLAAGVRFYGIAANDERGLLATPTGVTVQPGTAGTYGALNTSRYAGNTAILPNGQALLMGGQNSTTLAYLSSTELYDPATGLFTLGASMSTPRLAAMSTTLSTGAILICGGLNGAFIQTSEIYDPVTSSFLTVGSMAAPRQGGAIVTLKNGKVLVAGGQTTSSVIVATAELFDPTTQTWTTTGAMGTARLNPSYSILPNGNVLVSGGFNGATGIATAEIYNPNSGTWFPTTNTPAARHQAPAVLLNSGVVLISGGIVAGVAVTTGELFNPGTNTFSAAGAMGVARFNHQLALLNNSKVLAAGGTDIGGLGLATAELYSPLTNTYSNIAGGMATAHGNYFPISAPSTQNVVIAGGLDVTGNTTALADVYNPSTNAFTPLGLHGSSTRYYRVAFQDTSGGKTLPSAEVSAVIPGDTSATIGWTVPIGTNAKTALIYGRATGAELLIGTAPVSAGLFVDTGTVPPTSALPTSNTTSGQGPILDQRSLMRVYASQNDVNWRPLQKPVPPLAYTNQTSGVPAYYDIREQIELWPPPPDSTWQLRILGAFTLGAFDAETDITTLDWQAIHLFALAKAKATWNRPDAKVAMGEAQAYVGELVAGSHGTARYLPGGRILPSVTRPLMIPPFP